MCVYKKILCTYLKNRQRHKESKAVFEDIKIKFIVLQLLSVFICHGKCKKDERKRRQIYWDTEKFKK